MKLSEFFELDLENQVRKLDEVVSHLAGYFYTSSVEKLEDGRIKFTNKCEDCRRQTKYFSEDIQILDYIGKYVGFGTFKDKLAMIDD